VHRFLKIAPLVFATIALFLVVLTLRLMFLSPFVSPREEDTLKEKSFHFAFFLPSSQYPFFQTLKEGALNATENMDCSISFHDLDSDPLSLDMVPYSGVDGIGIYAPVDDEYIRKALGHIAQAGIPIVQIENEVLRDETTFFIGTNNFESGKAIGSLAEDAKLGLLNIALIYSDKNPGFLSEGNLVEMGLVTVLGPRLNHLITDRTSSNPLDGERLTYELMLEAPSIDIIVLTNPMDTLVTVQAVIDLNLVGEVQIIGFGDDPTIMEYIEKGLLLGTIVRNPHRIGFSAVMALQEISTMGYTSAYVDTGLSVISPKTIGRIHD
jgi:ribose transport system substrate-binding protein